MHQPTALTPNGPTLSRLVVGVLKWGQWGHGFNKQAMLGLIEQGLELGLTTFDHADIWRGLTLDLIPNSRY